MPSILRALVNGDGEAKDSAQELLDDIDYGAKVAREVHESRLMDCGWSLEEIQKMRHSSDI